LQLIVPDLDHLDGYADALRRGWSPDNVRLDEAAREELARIQADPAAFVASLDDPEARGGDITLPDGTMVKRMPGYRRWMWDGAFCGSIGFRWQPGTAELPTYVLGHIGYAVAPWKRRHGYATRALFQLMFSREANRIDLKDGEAGAGGVRRLQAAIVDEALADASGEVRQRMADFAWASMHGFITLVLEGEIGGRDSSRALKSRGLAVLAAMAETVVRAAR